MADQQAAASVKQRNIQQQLDPSRDFAEPGTPVKRYVICCTHRSGSNLLSEALYRTSVAGDPMEYLNRGFLQEYAKDRGSWNFTFADLMSDMQARRTSPNGVFGLNVKYDQMQTMFRRVPNPFTQFLKQADHVVFLYRQDRLQQAISTWKGQQRDTFNVYADEAETAPTADDDLTFDGPAIAQRLHRVLAMEQQWRALFDSLGIAVQPLTYETLTADYDATVRHMLSQLGVDAGAAAVPDPPTVKMRSETDARLREQFLAHIGAG
ncbi:LPS sulfotransferase NodH [Limimonas halophila]|uniref:LPS sulfotransferase NodH n=1 Tax=Limimonas halophila TaxID=1082479 RepID=A0A1G7Q4P6_9PROT|nr:Stf0 family sulfotransferase [Limimonas halophila]SDF92909.1 LPS sulfotransferase NodH [Limimonas halophila]